MHAPFTVFPRKLKRRTIWYVAFRDQDEKRLPARSSGQTSKAAAINWANEYMKAGRLPSRDKVTLRQFTPTVWEWDSLGATEEK